LRYVGEGKGANDHDVPAIEDGDSSISSGL